jgi:cyanophycin synthetase
MELGDIRSEMQVGPLSSRTAYGSLHRSTTEILDVAASRGIPFIVLDEKRHPLIQLGHGKHQRRIRTTTTSMTSFLGANTALDKALTIELLRATGVPVPRSIPVNDARAAVEAATAIGYPVVLKPRFGKSGIGVSVDLRSARDVRRAFAMARKISRDADCIIERQIPGRDFRVLVIGGESVAVTEWGPARVVGDGSHSVEELVAILNADPRRGSHKEKPLTRIPLGPDVEGCLAQQGLTLRSVPDAGSIVQLAKSYASLSEGGTAIDRTDEIHPENRLIAEIAVAAVGLDVAGVDIVADDIGVPLYEGGGAVVEVNQSAGLRGHLYPVEGRPRDVVGQYLDLLFPGGSDGRIPIIAVAASASGTATVPLIAHLLAGAGRVPGAATTSGVTIGALAISTDDASGRAAAERLLRNPIVDIAVLEISRESVAAGGLGYDRNDVAVVTRPNPQRTARRDGSERQEDSDDVVLARAVPPSGVAVIDAEHPQARRLVRECPGSVVLVAGRRFEDDRLDSHRARGGAAIGVETLDEKEWLVLLDSDERRPIVATGDIPALRATRTAADVTDVLAAAAAAWAVGVRLDEVGRGLRTFGRA